MAGNPMKLGGTSCQVASRDNAPLNQIMGVECNISKHSPAVCDCTSTYQASGWTALADSLHGGMALDALPGDWFLTDPDQKCIAVAPNGPLLLRCPPGFYCNGGLSPPKACRAGDHCPGGTTGKGRKCPEHHFCLTPLAPIETCIDGGLCPPGSSLPEPCPAGQFCVGGESAVCPAGHVCPYGTSVPIVCGQLSRCPEGSAFEDKRIIAGAIFLCVLAVWYVAMRRSKNMTRVRALSAVSLLAVPLIMASKAVGFFVLVCLGLVSVHLLFIPRLARASKSLGRLVSGSTLLGIVALVALVDHIKSLMLFGFLVSAFIGFLMARQDQRFALCGRGLLVCGWGAMLYIFWCYDPVGVHVFLGAFSLLTGAILLVWAFHLASRCTAGCVWQLFVGWICSQLRMLFRGPSASRCSLAAVPATSVQKGRRKPGAFQEDALSPLIPKASRGHPPLSGSECITEAPGPSTRSTTSEDDTYSLPSLPPEITDECWADAEAMEQGHGSCHATSSCHRQRGGVSFFLQDVNYFLPSGKQLLRDINLDIPAGCSVAIMGPSGCGKSTLFSVLSGRVSSGAVTGELRVSGHGGRDARFLRHVTGFVPQDDLLHGDLTVKENIEFQARLRLPEGDCDVQAHMWQIAEDLKLTGVWDSLVGSGERRGISGGQRKRTSIAMEMVGKPMLIFADEPSSGLDATTAHTVLDCLNRGAKHMGTTHLSVIHQPRYETLCLFDKLVLLMDGGVILYNGPADEAASWFADRLGVVFPPAANPADILMDVIITQPDVAAQAIVLVPKYTSLAPLQQSGGEPLSRFRRTMPSFSEAVFVYMERAFIQTVRGWQLLVTILVVNIGAVVVVCLLMKDEFPMKFVAQTNPAVMFYCLLQTISATRHFADDVQLSRREAKAGMSVIPFFVAKDLLNLFEVTTMGIAFALAYGSLSGYQQSLLRIFEGSFFFVYATYGLGYLIGVVVPAGAVHLTCVTVVLLSSVTAGVAHPRLPEIGAALHGRMWLATVISPSRWFDAYLYTGEAEQFNALTAMVSQMILKPLGFDARTLDEDVVTQAMNQTLAADGVVLDRDLWPRDAWVYNSGPINLLMLGLIFRFFACVGFVFCMHSDSCSLKRFFSLSMEPRWTLRGQLWVMLVASFLVLFLLMELSLLGVDAIDMEVVWQRLRPGFL